MTVWTNIDKLDWIYVVHDHNFLNKYRIRVRMNGGTVWDVPRVYVDVHVWLDAPYLFVIGHHVSHCFSTRLLVYLLFYWFTISISPHMTYSMYKKQSIKVPCVLIQCIYIYILYIYTQFAPTLHVSRSHEIFVHHCQPAESTRLENARAAIATAISNGEIVPMEKVLGWKCSIETALKDQS